MTKLTKAQLVAQVADLTTEVSCLRAEIAALRAPTQPAAANLSADWRAARRAAMVAAKAEALRTGRVVRV